MLEDTLTSHPVLACATPSPQRTAPVRSDGTKHARPMSSFDMPVDLSLLEPKRAQPSGGFQMPVDLSLRNPGTKRAKPGTKPAPVGSFDMLNRGAKPSQPGASFDMPEQVPAEDGADHASAVAAAASLAGQASAQPGHAGRLQSDLSKEIPWLWKQFGCALGAEVVAGCYRWIPVVVGLRPKPSPCVATAAIMSLAMKFCTNDLDNQEIRLIWSHIAGKPLLKEVEAFEHRIFEAWAVGNLPGDFASARTRALLSRSSRG